LARILAIDYGFKRTGLAVTDPMQIIANSLPTISTSELWAFLDKYFKEEEVECVAIGFPTKLNTEPTDTTSHVVGFVRKFQKTYPHIPIETVDERFTTVMAHQAILMGGVKKKDRQNKSLADAVSATIILQSYLDQRRIKLNR
jgi:putative Holliday junction resolvase